MFQSTYASPKKASHHLIVEHVTSMIKENYKQDVSKKDANDLVCSQPIGKFPWSTIYHKLRDPYWDKSNFLSKLTPEQGKLLIDQLQKELKHEA